MSLRVDVVLVARCSTCGCIVRGAQVGAVPSYVSRVWDPRGPLPRTALFDAVAQIGAGIGIERSPLPTQVESMLAGCSDLPQDCPFCDILTGPA